MSGIEIAERLHRIHTHAELLLNMEGPMGMADSGDLEETFINGPDEIIYKEEDVIQLLKDLGHPEPDWDGYAKQCEELEKK